MAINVIQPSIATYRLDFFERLYKKFGSDFKVYYSPGELGVLDEDEVKDWSIKVGKIRSLPAKLFWQPEVAWLKIRPNDVVVLSGNPRYLSTLILFARAKFIGARVVWWGHYWSSTSKRWRQILRFLPMAAADVLLFYTDEEVKAYSADSVTLFKNKKSFALNNGINIDPIKRLRVPYSAVQRENSILFIGRLTEKANLSLLLEAMSTIGNNCPKLYIVGDGEEYNQLNEMVSTLNLAGKVEWCGAIKNEYEISKIANKCKIFVYPGGVGLSLIHAMAYGLPAVVHDNRKSHMPEIAAFKEGLTGFSFFHNDPSSLAKKIVNLLLSSNDLDNFSKRSTAIIESNYNTASMAARFEKVIYSLED